MSSIKNATRKQLVIGLFGFGVVGKGIYDVLRQSPSFNARIKKICIRDLSKSREADPWLFTDDHSALLDDPEINVIVEVIDDAEAAYTILRRSLKSQKPFVTANKKMVAENLEEIIALQELYETGVLYEAACCASIPVIRNLEEYYDNDLLYSLKGIVNGSTNYILSQVYTKGLSYSEALLEAKQLGFAESDPSLDVKGYDAVNKLSLLIAHGYGRIINPSEILVHGINSISSTDTNYANRHRFKIKLVATVQKLKNNSFTAFVLPQFVKPGHELYHVDNEFNALLIESCFADKHFLKGKGAGAYPTAAAILSDLSALRYDYKYEYKKTRQEQPFDFEKDFVLKVYISAKNAHDIPEDFFLHIEERHSAEKEAWVVGTISSARLINGSWWKENGLSLVACPEAIDLNDANRRIRKKSLELAGVS